MGSAPYDLEIFELALTLNRPPDEIRAMSERDKRWLLVVKAAKALAEPELTRRAGG